MDTLVNIRGGNPGGRTKYFLNDEATALKLKKAATISDFQVIPHSGSTKINFSTGSYITTALPLLKAWQDIEGAYIDQEQVDGMVIRVGKIQTCLDLGDKIVKHEVKLMVEGQQVTVTLFDTTLSIMVQAGSILDSYCERALLPYLVKEIKRTSRRIEEINVQVLAIVIPKGTTRRQKKLFLKGSSILEQPSTPSSPRLRTLSSPSTPVTRVLDLPPSFSPHQDDSELEDPPSTLALPPPASPKGTPGLLARAASWLPGVLASPFLPSPRSSSQVQNEQRCLEHVSLVAPLETLTTPLVEGALSAPVFAHKEVALVQKSPQVISKEAGPSSLTKAGPPLEVAPRPLESLPLTDPCCRHAPQTPADPCPCK